MYIRISLPSFLTGLLPYSHSSNQPLQMSCLYMFLLSLSIPSYCPIFGPVFSGKGVRFTTSEDVYPEKGMLPLRFRT